MYHTSYGTAEALIEKISGATAAYTSVISSVTFTQDSLYYRILFYPRTDWGAGPRDYDGLLTLYKASTNTTCLVFIHLMIPGIMMVSSGSVVFKYTVDGVERTETKNGGGGVIYGKNGLTNTITSANAISEITDFRIISGWDNVLLLSLPYIRITKGNKTTSSDSGGEVWSLSGDDSHRLMNNLTKLGFLCGRLDPSPGSNVVSFYSGSNKASVIDLQAFDWSSFTFGYNTSNAWFGFPLGGVIGNTTTNPQTLRCRYADLSNIGSFTGSFHSYNTLDEIDLTGVKMPTEHSWGMKDAFRQCTSVTKIIFSPSFNTSKCVWFQNVFYGCTNLLRIEGMDWDWGKAGTETFKNSTDNASGGYSINSAFGACTSLTTITGTWTNVKKNMSFVSSSLDQATTDMIVNSLFDYNHPQVNPGFTPTIKFKNQGYANSNSTVLASRATYKGWTLTLV